MARDRTRVRCPTCNKFGSRELGGYCKTHVVKDESYNHISETYVTDYKVSKPFIPDSFGIFKDKCDMVD